jgi:uncharacterized protein YbjT (DUF2867 family)
VLERKLHGSKLRKPGAGIEKIGECSFFGGICAAPDCLSVFLTFMINPVIIGSSGMIGQAVLLECIADPEVGSVLLLNRRPGLSVHPKVREVVIPDFSDLSKATPAILECDVCFFCAGVTALGKSVEEYRKITFDLTVQTAEHIISTGKSYAFCYISGAGTDSTEKGKTMWARVKGMTENKLLSMPFRAAFMFRPGYIQPMKGIRSKTGLYNLFYLFFKPLYFLLRPFGKYVTDSASLGKAMIYTAKHGYEKKLIESEDINRIAALNKK